MPFGLQNEWHRLTTKNQLLDIENKVQIPTPMENSSFSCKNFEVKMQFLTPKTHETKKREKSIL
jgi:hypothetical protein